MAYTSTTPPRDDLANKASDFTRKAGDTLERNARDVENMARDAADQSRDALRNVQVAVDRSVREQPMTTLMIAAAVGFVVGAIWKS